MTERHCDNWRVMEPSLLSVCLNDKELLADGHAFDVITCSPGYCIKDKKNVDVNRGVVYTSESNCYTCKKNTLPMGQGFNGQGA
jgi:hypothetical protein